MDNVIKQGYLRKAKLSSHSQSTLKMNLMQVFEPMRWYVFGVRERHPYMEYYDREESIFAENAINTFDISTCSKVTYTLGRTNRNHTFCIVLSDRVLELTADSRDSMLDWCNSVETNLKNMGILTSAANGDDHVYEPFESLIGCRKALSRSTSIDPPIDHSAPASSMLLVASETSIQTDLHTLQTPEQNVATSHRWLLLDDGTEEEVFHSLGSIRDMMTNTENVEQTVNKEQSSNILLQKNTRDMNDEHSDEDTSNDADFVGASFWLRNRKTLNEKSLLSLQANLSVLTSEPDNGDVTPVPPPRRRKSENFSGVQARPNYQLIDIPPPLPSRSGQLEPMTKIVDIEALDDGYQTIMDFKTLSKVNNLKSSDKTDSSKKDKHGEHSSKIGDKLVVELVETATSYEKMDRVDTCVNSCSRNVHHSTHSRHSHQQQPDDSKSENFYAPFPLTSIDIQENPPSRLSSASQQIMQIYEPVMPLVSISDDSTNSSSLPSTGQMESRGGASYVHSVPEEYQSLQESLSSVSCAAGSIPNQSMMQSNNIYEDISFRNPPPLPARSMSSSIADAPVVPVRLKSVNRPVSEFVRRIPSPVPTTSKTDDDIKKDAPVVPVRLKSVNRPVSEFVRRIPSPVPTTSKTDDDVKKACSGNQQKCTNHQPVPQVSQNVVTLKQSQVELLRGEMGSAGLIITLPAPFCQVALAIVGAYDGVWIAGWDVEKGPRQYDRFHIGDRLLAINNIRVTNITMAQRHLKAINTVDIELTIKRLPYGQVFIIRRSAEGESLGIKRDGGTAEIMYVDPNGLAAKHGLSRNAQNVIGDCICNWCLTEINNRSLNLFFKNTEIEHRLNAVGKDISFVVQPVDFIRELKKQLKKIKNYKDFIVQ